MADSFSTLIAQVREIVIDTSTTNPALADADIVKIANPIYRFLAARDAPYVTPLTGAQTGWSVGSGGGTSTTSTTNSLRRILSVKNTGLSTSSTRGTPLHYLTRPEYELERQFDSATTGSARCGHWFRNTDGTWTLLIHPGTGGATVNFAADAENEVVDLVDGTSVIFLSQALASMFVTLTAIACAGALRRTPDVVQGIASTAGDKKILSDWLASEEQRGNMLVPARRFG